MTDRDIESLEFDPHDHVLRHEIIDSLNLKKDRQLRAMPAHHLIKVQFKGMCLLQKVPDLVALIVDLAFPLTHRGGPSEWPKAREPRYKPRHSGVGGLWGESNAGRSASHPA